jgi:hypothetical protein
MKGMFEFNKLAIGNSCNQLDSLAGHEAQHLQKTVRVSGSLERV